MTTTRTAPHPMLDVAPEVAAALSAGTPVVALESTIISHGMPYPHNVAMAREVEQIVRDGGAVPATIAVLGGRPTIGLSATGSSCSGPTDRIRKVSVRDLPHVVATGAHGATTVASTMRLAGLAGIRVFVTGGLGGVHRGAEHSWTSRPTSPSSSRTEVAVISAGVKSILDIARTLEVLETLGVPVVGYGTDEFPSFFSRSSGVRAPMRLDTPEEVAALMRRDLGPRPRQRRRDRQPGARRGGDAARRDRRGHRAGPRGLRRARRPGQGHHALPAGPDRRALRRAVPRDQPRAGAPQRPGGDRDRGGLRRA